MFKFILIFLSGIIVGNLLYLHALDKNYIKIPVLDISILQPTPKKTYWNKFLIEYVNKMEQLYQHLCKTNE
ncbi:hypothetical protein [Candidatus Phytoplasma phoenicium]|uniref:hypothetical protein n=1 Tax=Candidatus Phytoplasma phoenicium TaxID=198422 RepID=UPI00067D4BC0|nr:hypothetical protein [Candidatus Phytoplasma phoenicium]